MDTLLLVITVVSLAVAAVVVDDRVASASPRPTGAAGRRASPRLTAAAGLAATGVARRRSHRRRPPRHVDRPRRGPRAGRTWWWRTGFWPPAPAGSGSASRQQRLMAAATRRWPRWWSRSRGVVREQPHPAAHRGRTAAPARTRWPSPTGASTAPDGLGAGAQPCRRARASTGSRPKCSVFDPAGILIATRAGAWSPTWSWSPGQESPFAVALGESATTPARYRVSFRAAGTLRPHVDHRTNAPASVDRTAEAR